MSKDSDKRTSWQDKNILEVLFLSEFKDCFD